MHWPGRKEKARKLLNFNILFGHRGKLQVTMQSSSAEVTMMESQKRKRAPAWTEWEVRDLIAVWGEESVLSELCSSFRNAKTFVKISQGMKDRGHNRDPKQCRVKLKELRQAYQKTREANGRSGSEPQTCRFYDELHAILGGSATTTPAVLFDSFNGHGGNTEPGFGDEEDDDDDDDEVVDSSQQASGETSFPDSQELFLTLDLEPVPPPNPPKAASRSRQRGKGPPRLAKIRRRKKSTRYEMFSELMLSSHTGRAQRNAWRQTMSECRKAQNDREERWRTEESPINYATVKKLTIRFFNGHIRIRMQNTWSEKPEPGPTEVTEKSPIYFRGNRIEHICAAIVKRWLHVLNFTDRSRSTEPHEFYSDTASQI
ncbi:hypothetical protein UY3_01107 [Chelonia mydas]|uniref:Myb/SANT-like DNA-binding domain-containing protein n=1 Tax=Chelonia mydas TaxID=8469 RepID=M7C0G6_CHEMY|nr:hypothetical protein UY3_01107 [Chelonia mydas]